jgi:hypothetical protein
VAAARADRFTDHRSIFEPMLPHCFHASYDMIRPPYDMIMDLARQGVAVIVVSSDLEGVLGVSNRIMVMAHGKQAGILDRKDANDVSVMELATS